MGFWISYVVTQASEEDLLASLGLSVVSEEEEMPHGKWWMARFKETDWLILWSEDVNYVQDNFSSLAELSAKAVVIGCTVGEGANWSQASKFRDGSMEWSVNWVGDKGPQEIQNLTIEGSLSENDQLDIERVIENQKQTKSVDLIFDVPINLASKESGFRFDMYLEPNSVEAFRVVKKSSARLQATPSTNEIGTTHPKSNWLQKLMGTR